MPLSSFLFYVICYYYFFHLWLIKIWIYCSSFHCWVQIFLSHPLLVIYRLRSSSFSFSYSSQRSLHLPICKAILVSSLCLFDMSLCYLLLFFSFFGWGKNSLLTQPKEMAWNIIAFIRFKVQTTAKTEN